jgi:transcriptional regulator with XRE-family HTH domain
MLKNRRQELELSLYELSKLSGVSPSKLSLAERDLINLAEWEKARVAEVLGVPAPELFSRTGERALYRSLKKFMSLDEKIWLIDVGHDPEIYKQRLADLAKKYAAVLGTS